MRALAISGALAGGVLLLAVLGEGWVTPLIAVLAVLLQLLRLLLALIRRRRPALRLAGARLGIWLLAVLGIAAAFVAHVTGALRAVEA